MRHNVECYGKRFMRLFHYFYGESPPRLSYQRPPTNCLDYNYMFHKCHHISNMPTTALLRASPVPSPTFLRTFGRSFSSAPSLFASSKSNSSKEKALKEKQKRRRKRHATFKQHDLKEVDQFALCDAMRYIRAFEVGRPGDVTKYEAHVKLKTKRDGPVLRNQIRLPHSVKTDIKIAVICPPDSNAAKDARAAGAVLVGEEEIFQVVKDGKIDFDRCLAVPASLPKMAKEGLPRILGPKGMMPSAKLGTVVDNVGNAVRTMLGGSQYRERVGVVRMAIGQLKFTPEQLRENLKTFIAQLKKDAAAINDQGAAFSKEIYEVVCLCGVISMVVLKSHRY